MLVLMRRRDESVMIGDAITVTVMEVEGNRVKLGINAPKDVPVDREEIHEAKKREQQGLPPIGHKRRTG